MRQIFVRYILIALFSTVFGLLIFSALQFFNYPIDDVQVKLELKILEDDQIQLFYLHKDSISYTENSSIRRNVIGQRDAQSIEFNISDLRDINSLRIDLGSNVVQKPITISSISFITQGGVRVFDNWRSFFDPNYCLTELKEGVLEPKLFNGVYDPFIVLQNFDVVRPFLIKNRFVSFLIGILSALIGLLAAYFIVKIPLIYLGQGAFSLVFLIIIMAPVGSTFFGFQDLDNSKEKRNLKNYPEFFFDQEWPELFESYFSENFGLRNYLVNIGSKLKVNWFGVSPSPLLVQFGKASYLYFTDADDVIYPSYTNRNLMSEDELTLKYNELKERVEGLNSKNISITFAFWPNKHSIYPEYMPNTMKAQIIQQEKLSGQLKRYLKSKNIDLIDVTDDLKSHKDSKQLYLKLDTHWNADGAFVAYKSFFRQSFDQLGVTSYPETEFNVEYKSSKNGDLVHMIGLDSIEGYFDRVPFYEPVRDEIKFSFVNVDSLNLPANTIATKNENATNKNRVVVFRDSFCTDLVQFLSLHFREVFYIWTSYDEEVIDSLSPNNVIVSSVERHLSYL